jgi:hypothetical protein
MAGPRVGNHAQSGHGSLSSIHIQRDNATKHSDYSRLLAMSYIYMLRRGILQVEAVLSPLVFWKARFRFGNSHRIRSDACDSVTHDRVLSQMSRQTNQIVRDLGKYPSRRQFVRRVDHRGVSPGNIKTKDAIQFHLRFFVPVTQAHASASIKTIEASAFRSVA